MSSIDPARATSILELARNPDYPARALDAIVHIHLANDPPDLLDRLMSATAAIGATASLYTAAIPEDGAEPSSFSLFACDPGFARDQCDIGSPLNHPWFRFARTRATPGTDQQVPIRHGSDAAAIELARRYGFTSCLIVPTPAGIGLDRVEMLCLGSQRVDAFEGDDARIVRTLARSLAAELHDWLTGHLRQRLQQGARLQQSDVDLLALERQGLCTKEISLRTGLSMAAVDSRFQRINTRLKCANRKASARRAAGHGLLESP
jgi:hypothetical protein